MTPLTLSLMQLFHQPGNRRSRRKPADPPCPGKCWSIIALWIFQHPLIPGIYGINRIQVFLFFFQRWNAMH